MNRRKSRGGHHRAKPPQANTAITAAIILTIMLLCALVIWAICASHAGGNKGTQTSSQSNLPSVPAASSPLGGEPPSSGVPGHLAHAVTTHILVDEPLIGGTGVDKERAVQSSTPAPRERQAIELMQVEVVEAQAARVRADLVARINAFLGHSPMRGLGECMMQNAERTGVWVMLCPAQAYAESSLGAVCCYPFQAWGMYGVHPSSWEDAIARYFDNIVKHWGPAQNCHELVNPDYCEPCEPYNSNVQGLAESI